MLSDFKVAFRSLLKSPGFTTVAVITLALGIGAVTAVYSVLNPLLLRLPPYPDAERLVAPVSIHAERGLEVPKIAYADYQDWRNEGMFERLAIVAPAQASVHLSDEAGASMAVREVYVSEDYFNMLGIRKALLGRTFLSDEYRMSNGRPCLLSHRLWRQRYRGDAHIIGRTILTDGSPCPVVGVLPPVALWPAEGDLVRPILADRTARQFKEHGGDFLYFRALAQLKPGMSLEQTNVRLTAIAQRWQQEYPQARKGWSNRTVSLQEVTVGKSLRVMLLTAMAAVLFVLAIAIINVASLLLARAITRRHEMQVRAALGAGGWQMTRHLLAESLLLALMSGGLGLLLAAWALDVVRALNLPGIPPVQIDLATVGVALGLAIATAVICGLAPLVHALRRQLNPAHTAATAHGRAGAAGGRLLKGLVVAEVALSIVLLAGAGLLIRSFLAVQRIDPGLETERVLAIDIHSRLERLSSIEKNHAFYRNLIEQVQNTPGVLSASVSSALPLGGGGVYFSTPLWRERQLESSTGVDHEAMVNLVSPGFFQSMGIQRIAGRDFDVRDRPNVDLSNPVMIINEALARRTFPNENPLGKCLYVPSLDAAGVCREIIGIVKDVRYLGLEDELRGLVYAPLQGAWPTMALIVRTLGEPSAVLGLVRSQIKRHYPDLVLTDVRTMEGILEQSTASRRSSMLLLTVLAGVALVLAAVGLYGVLSYMVTQRVREVGVRMALGAQPRSILRMVFGQGSRLTLTGVALGVVGAFVLTRLMSSLLYEVTATDPTTFIAVTVFLTGVALAACYVPARRATRIDPLIALRAE